MIYSGGLEKDWLHSSQKSILQLFLWKSCDLGLEIVWILPADLELVCAWVLVRMSRRRVSFSDGKQCKGGRRWSNPLVVLFVLCCVGCSICLLWGLEVYGILERKVRVRALGDEREKTLLDQYNLSKDRVQALALLISSLNQVPLTLPSLFPFYPDLDLWDKRVCLGHFDTQVILSDFILLCRCSRLLPTPETLWVVHASFM